MDDHASVINHAIAIMKADGQQQYGKVLDMFVSDLVRGGRFADRAGPRIRLDLKIHWTCTTIKTIEFDLGNEASFGHYYDPFTDQGLDLSGFGSLGGLIQGLGPIVAGIFLGAAGVWFDYSTTVPLDFDNPYPSAADLCQQHYDKALALWTGQEYSGNPWTEAMFHLGWASHFLADMAVSAHTTSSSLSVFLSHNEFEEYMVGLQQLAAGHQGGLGGLAAYRTGDSARQMAVDAATESRQELQLYEDGLWDEAAALAIPRAERYTARLFTKFLQDAHVSTLPKPLELRVLDRADGPIPDAFVFYRRQGQAWRWVRTDATGVAMLTLAAQERVELRPAVPGYLYKGRHYGTAVEEFPPPASPVIYTHEANPVQVPSLCFDLEKVAQPQGLGEVALTPLQWPWGAHPGLLPEPLGPVGTPPGVEEVAGLRVMDPRIALRKTDPVPAAMADQVLMEVLGADDEQTPLTVGAPRQWAIRVQVFTPLLFPGQLVVTADDFGRLVASAPPARAVAPEGVRPVDPNARRIDPDVQAALEHAPRLGQEGEAATTYAVPFGIRSGIYSRTAAIPVPSGLAYRFGVEFLHGPGLVGSACTPRPAPFETHMGPYESAEVFVGAGSEAGLLRLRVTVTREQDGVVIAERYVETVVRPADQGPDSTPLQPPHLAPPPTVTHVVTGAHTHPAGP